MKEVKQEIENNISRIKRLIEEKTNEIGKLKREINTLSDEKWKYEELCDKMNEIK